MTAPLSASNPSYRSIYRAGLLEGKVVIVTGGGSGIGRCTAHELASLGATVALLGRTREKLDGNSTAPALKSRRPAAGPARTYAISARKKR